MAPISHRIYIHKPKIMSAMSGKKVIFLAIFSIFVRYLSRTLI